MVQVPRGKLGAFLRNELCVPCWHLHTHVCSDTGGRTGFAQRGIRGTSRKSFRTNGLRMRQDPLDMGQAGITSKDARHGIAPPVPCITQALTVD